MKTQVIMKRDLFGNEIRQQSKTQYLSAKDLLTFGNKWRVSNGLPIMKLQDWLHKNNTEEFVRELEIEYGVKSKIATKGRYGETWMHPFLFIKLALSINPKLEVKVMEWLYDNLLQFRNDSGDSYLKMSGALYFNSTNKKKFPKAIKETANYIKKKCIVDDWSSASEKQLKLRNQIHENIALLADVLKDNNQAIRLGIAKALDD